MYIRPDWDSYFMDMAFLASKRSTCLRRQVGAVIVKDKQVLATGYNGAPKGLPHCEETGCIRQKLGIPPGEQHQYCRSTHSEQNAIAQAAKHGISVDGATLYCTHQPCSICTKIIINAGIKRIVYANPYPDELARELMSQADIEVEVFGGETNNA